MPEIETVGDTRWFVDGRFGLFIHWGLYSLGARHEWLKHREEIPDEAYQRYFDHFDPDLYAPTQGVLGGIMAWQRQDTPSAEQRKCLLISRLAIDSSERPTAVVGRGPSGKSRADKRGIVG